MRNANCANLKKQAIKRNANCAICAQYAQTPSSGINKRLDLILNPDNFSICSADILY